LGCRTNAAAAATNQQKGANVKFFVSYAGTDLKFAKWAVWELENAKQRYRCISQFRDFAPGMNFMQRMRKAAEADCTLALFSSHYFRSNYCSQELDAALTGSSNRLLPVRIGECDPGKFLANRIYIDLVERSLDEAREILLSGVEAYVSQTLKGHSGPKFRKRPPSPFPLHPKDQSAFRAAAPEESSGPLKVLFLAPEVGGLNPRGQLHEMQKSVGRARHLDSIRFKGIFKAHINTLFEGLNRELPDVFHFSGKQNGGDILMRAEDGSLITVSDMALAGMFRSLDRGLRLVIVDTCYSMRCATTIAKAVPCSIGVEGDPYEAETVDFYKVFYQTVASGRSLKDAVIKAQTALRLAKVPSHRIPQLCCQTGVDPARIVLVHENAI
jgi:hypothetical protein